MLTWKIAWRNVWRHKGKSLVIGIILFLGAMLMTVGDAVIQGAREGLAQNLIQRFTGHLVIASVNEKLDEVFFGPPRALKVIPDYPAIKSLLEQQEFVEGFVPMTRGDAVILNDEGKMGGTLVFGVNFDEYQRMFLHNVEAVEGDLLKNGERGVLISDKARERIFDNQKFWALPEGGALNPDALTTDAKHEFEQNRLHTKDQLIMMGFSTTSLQNDIIVPVKGIFRFKSLNNVWEGISFMDIESYRECFGYATAADNTANTLTETEQNVLAAESIDDIFGDAAVIEPADIAEEGYDLQAMQAQTRRDPNLAVDLDHGAYNLVAIKLKSGVTLNDGEQRLREALTKANMPVKVLTWKQATGEISDFANITQGALSVFVLFIFFVAIIVIMNTLSMAAIERTAEIGMMRAVGARKRFISKMFLAETAILSSIFGGIGICAGVVIAWLIAAQNISVTGNQLLSLLFGGDTLHPVVHGSGLISGVIQLAIVTLVAVLYPVIVARKITPLEAISRD